MVQDVFISYSRKDSEVANKIFDALTEAGISCFIDREGISGGADFPTVLSEAIMGAKVLLLVASEHSYESEFTQKELTFAVSNKGSRFIFPLIVDGSTLPKNLEFLLSNINWRTLSSRYRVEKELVEDIRQKLADPHAGETLKQREKSNVKTVLTMISVLVVIGMGVLFASLYQQNKERKMEEARAQQEKNDATMARKNCENWKAEAALLLVKADSLRSVANPLQTFSGEFESLDGAGKLLSKADSVRRFYRMGQYNYLFTDFSVDDIRTRVVHKRDSMFTNWYQIAIGNYEDYQLIPDEESKSVAMKYVDMALKLRPENLELTNIKTTLLTQ